MMRNVVCAAATLAAAMIGAGVANASSTVTFNPGTYYLAYTDFGSPVDTLVVSISGGNADFTLSGSDNETFTVPNNSVPDLVLPGPNPVYDVSSLPSYSWDSSAYPYLTFYTNSNGGGMTIGSQPSDVGSNLVNLFQSSDGTGQVFSISGVPEPATWLMMLAGLGLAGAALRSRRRLAVA